MRHIWSAIRDFFHNVFRDRRRALLVGGAVLAVLVVAAGVLLATVRTRTPGAGSAASTSATAPQLSTSAAPSSSTPATMSVLVYFHQGDATDPHRVVAVTRTVPKSPMVATAALTELLGGPTKAEADQGYWSMFQPGTAHALIGVRIAGGVAHADFTDFRAVIPNASSSFGSTALLAELDGTLRQFPTVSSTVYSFNGDVAAFYQWLQLAPPTSPGDRAPVVAAARQFLTGVVGMTNPAEGPFQWNSSGMAEVTFYARSPNTGEPVTGQATVVVVQRRVGNDWIVTASRTENIQVDSPGYQQQISSPVHVAGRAHTFEGNVVVRVLANRGGHTVQLGQGSVTGGGDQPRPFAGDIAFTAPNANTGWVIFTEQSAANGQTVIATSIMVGFTGATEPPVVGPVSASPNPPVSGGWLVLPKGSGSITFGVPVTGADRVEFQLTPAGTDTATTLGAATRSGDTWSFTWRYPDEPVLAHLVVVATGPGGRTESSPLDVYHD